VGLQRRKSARPLRRRILVALVAALALPAVTLQAAPAAATAPITVISSSQWIESLPGGMQVVHIVGQVQNTSGADVAFVTINFSWRNAADAVIGHSYTVASKNVLSDHGYSPFEDVEFPGPSLHYDHFVVGDITYSRSTAHPYHLDAASNPCPLADPADEVCGTVTNNGPVVVEGVNAIVTYVSNTNVTVGQDRWAVDTDLGSTSFAHGDTGHFKFLRSDGHSPVSILVDAEPAYPVDLNPASLDFGNQFVKTTSPVKTVTVTNTGARALAIPNISASSDFGATTNCPTSLPALASCSVAVSFTPSVRAAETGLLSITSDGAGSPDTIPLTGTGIAPAVSLAVSGGPDFGSVAVGTISAAKPITLTNVGSAPLVVTQIAVSGDFVRTDPNACLGALDIQASCVITVAFTPALPGPRTGTLTLTDNALDNPQQLVLTGVGLGRNIIFNPPSLTFDSNVAVSQLTVTVTNNGTVDITITGVSAETPFSASGCAPPPLTLSPQSSCVITVTFDAGSIPSTGPGPTAGLLKVSDSLGDQYLLLVGNTRAGRGPSQSSGGVRTNPPPPPPPKN
jgi:hypothetical protein